MPIPVEKSDRPPQNPHKLRSPPSQGGLGGIRQLTNQTLQPPTNPLKLLKNLNISKPHHPQPITLQNLSPELMEEIEDLSRKSIGAISSIFKEGIDKNVFIDQHPVALADIFWALFSGVILWNTSKRIIDTRKDYLMQTLQAAFEVFGRGVTRTAALPAQ